MVWIGNPSADLADTIDFCWCSSGATGAEPVHHEFFPDAGSHLVFRLSPSGSRLTMLGPATEKATIQLAGRAEYFGIRFRPGQAPRLADVAPGELTDGHVDLDALNGMRLDDLAERAAAAPDPAARLRVFEGLLRGRAPLVRDERCRRAAALLDARGGTVRVEELASGFGLHARSLERLFLASLGLSPKRLSRLVRLRRVLGRLRAADYGTQADLAYDCGYADQSHLIRDFRDLIGRAPGGPESFRTQPVAGKPRTRIVHPVRR